MTLKYIKYKIKKYKNCTIMNTNIREKNGFSLSVALGTQLRNKLSGGRSLQGCFRAIHTYIWRKEALKR